MKSTINCNSSDLNIIKKIDLKMSIVKFIYFDFLKMKHEKYFESNKIKKRFIPNFVIYFL